MQTGMFQAINFTRFQGRDQIDHHLIQNLFYRNTLNP